MTDRWTVLGVLCLLALIAVTVVANAEAHYTDGNCRDGQYRCWKHTWRSLPSGTRAYVRSVEWCESRGRPVHSADGVHHGRLQWNLSTAWAAGFERDPHRVSRFQERVRAYRFAKRHGWQHWSCS